MLHGCLGRKIATVNRGEARGSQYEIPIIQSTSVNKDGLSQRHGLYDLYSNSVVFNLNKEAGSYSHRPHFEASVM
jgi:hypothetical protein